MNLKAGEICMNQFTSASDPKELEKKHDLIRYMGKYGGIIALYS